ncbi:MAG: pyrroline-5-carboxylate reductase [Spirochaetaceae bacterium]|nr:pyrroline-5-carboxylate reductase [Spirochaetaceae bacterium]MBQ8385143.1 pyrroline-5-carboxylate reductase [Spirochaetaceae bacterium]MBR2461891.1 pyrroline-5-carboxylate reductase [Spirochaetaceae bacterium]
MDVHDTKVACIGVGMMGGALMRAVVSVVGGQNLVVSDGTPSKAAEFAQATGCQAATSNGEAVSAAEVIFLAVKPNMIQTVVQEVAPLLAGKTVVSMAAGLKLATIREMYRSALSTASGPDASVEWVRIMPNLPAVVGEGMVALCGLAETCSATLSTVEALLAAAGRVEVVEERLMDAVTAISGSGPAYGFIFIEALADAAVKLGMPRQQAYIYAAQTLKGAAAMQLETGRHPADLKDGVCSPAGTTIAAVEALEQKGFRSSIMAAATAAYNRSVELG